LRIIFWGGEILNRTLLACFFAWIITRLFYWMSGLNPIRDFAAVPGYSIDLGIWLALCGISYWLLSILGIGRMTRK
jgi:hypothetical protein